MFRTRDFLLLFTIIVFLVGAIGVTIFDQWQADRTDIAVPVAVQPTASSSDLILTGSVPGDVEGERIERLNRMREKVAAVDFGSEIPDSAVEPTITTTTPMSTDDDASDEFDSTGVITCAEYAPYLGFWDSRGATVAVREGAVIVERTFESGPVALLQLPVRSLPAATPTCISTDVIGVANDGSLIRNDESLLYSIFGAETRIGYSLDGFPIYGLSSVRGDVCGGRVDETGQYRYELSGERTTVINCFAGAPAQLP